MKVKFNIFITDIRAEGSESIAEKVMKNLHSHSKVKKVKSIKANVYQ